MKKIFACFVVTLMFSTNVLAENEYRLNYFNLGKGIGEVMTKITDFLKNGETISKEESHKVDVLGQEFMYKGLKPSYKTGETVRITYPMIATDTDYTFFLDDEYIRVDYSESEGFIISFTMPDRDVVLSVEEKNTMLPYNDIIKIK